MFAIPGPVVRFVGNTHASIVKLLAANANLALFAMVIYSLALNA
jgi:hypothetical protein